MIRPLLLFIGLLFIVNLSLAQGNLTGRIYENKTKFSLSGISVQNLKSNTITVSDQNGLFSIRAHIGDLVTFSGFSYQTDTLYVKDLNNIEIFLELKQNMLKEVKVINPETNLGNLKASPTLSPFGGDKVVYQTDASGNYVGGLTAHLFDSHSGAKKRQKEAGLVKNDETNSEISKVFSPQNLQNYLPIKDQELENFIILYKPNIDTYTSGDFNLTVYLDSCYKEFLKIPEEKRKSKHYLDLNNKDN